MIKHLSSALLYLALATASLPAGAARVDQPLSQPTKDAFAALFALPQGMDGGETWWEQSDLEKPKDEAELITALGKAKQAGAKLNAYDHMGTLLHHALRGGEEDTALWLLHNGANPHLQVLTLEGKPDGNDAMALAILYSRQRVIDKLLTQGYATRSGEQDKATAWFNVLALTDAAAEARQTASLLPRLPLPQDPDLDCLLTTALDTGNVKLALAFAARGPRKQTRCLVYDNPFGAKLPPGRLDAFPAATLQEAEADLQLPLFPSLATLIKSPADIERLFTLPLHRPFDDPAFTKAVLVQILPRPIDPALKLALLKRIPPQALHGALAKAEILPNWLSAALSLPRQDFPWMMQQLDGAATAQVWKLLMERSADTARTEPRVIEPLLARLPKDSPAWNTNLLQLPKTEWALAYKLGYRPTQEHILAHLQGLRYQPPANLQADWQALAAISSATDRSRAWESLVRQFTVECDDTGARTTMAQLAQTVTAAGIMLSNPVPVSRHCQNVVAYPELARLHVLEAAATGRKAHFVLDTLACRNHPGVGLLHHLATLPAEEFGDIDHIDAIAITGAADCVYLVSSGAPGHRGYIEEDSSFYDGNIALRPCLDPTYHGELLNAQGHTLGEAAEGAPNGLWPLLDRTSGRHYYLTASGDGSTCDSGRPPQLLAREKNQLTRVPDTDDIMSDLHDQCDQDMLDQCSILLGHPVVRADWAPGAANRFIDITFPKERSAFLDALDHLDYDALKSAREKGISPGWLAAGMDQTGKGKYPLEEKRKRIAWLFRERSTLAKLLNDSSLQEPLAGMVDWLPLADWTPVLQEGRCKYNLSGLTEDAKNRGKAELAARLQRAAETHCRRQETKTVQ